MAGLTIDGKKIEAPDGASVLQVALDNGIWIPTLCHHDDLSDYGACRLCLVEVVRRGRRRVTASCTLPAQDGMEVITSSDRLTRLRRLVMELILASCPHSKAVMEMAEKLGVGTGRFEQDETNDCIRCGMCVRACAEISGAHAIDFANRGVDRTISTPFGTPNPECVLCGACVFVCPTGSRLLELAKIAGEEPRKLLSEFDARLKDRGAIHRPFPQALPNLPAIDSDVCLHLNRDACGICETVCEAEAIRFDDHDVEETIDVGAVVVTPGYDEFQSQEKYDSGYSQFADVVTSMEFERMLSASGPFAGHVVRPSDGKEPKKIAFLQCVGSRDISCRNAYCSSVCCMYAIKEAVIAKEHLKDVDVTVFFMDMRAFGKDFDKYYERAKSEYGVRFIRARADDVFTSSDKKSLAVRHTAETGEVVEQEFDLVVLSVGLEPGKDLAELAERLGVSRNEFGFLRMDAEHPVRTSRPGVFAAGVASGPKDIPESVVQAGAAACEAGSLLSEVKGTLTEEREYPPERDVSSEPPRIGAFICHCGINIGAVVDVPSVVEYARHLSHVVYAEDDIYTCSQDTQEHIREIILEHGLNRVVIASCSPRTHEPLFQQTLREAGLNPHLFTMANIRDQCSWIHRNEPEAATEKAKALVAAAVAKATLAQPLHPTMVPVVNKALVIGGGVAGVTAALAVADHGYEVLLLEKETQLGGNMRQLHLGFDGQDLPAMLDGLITRVTSNPLITVRCETTLKKVDGFIGNFTSTLSDAEEFQHGVAILATGAKEYESREYFYGEDKRVTTQKQLQSDMAGRTELPWKATHGRVVMIQCVGSRNDEHPYCSRVCCTRAVQNAIRIKELSPETEVVILYRDIRTYGFRELSYQQAREAGVNFIRFDEEEEPVVTSGDELRVRVREPLLNVELDLAADMLVLSTGIVPDSTAAESLAKLFKVPLNSDGFFMEAHVKLRPVEFATDGIYVAGLAHGPKSIDESVVQALAAASKACTVLQKTEIETQAAIAEVLLERCVGCGLCELLCAYGAVSLGAKEIAGEDRVVAEVNPALCKGCGACAAGCRSGAINLHGFTDQQVIAEIKQL